MLAQTMSAAEVAKICIIHHCVTPALTSNSHDSIPLRHLARCRTKELPLRVCVCVCACWKQRGELRGTGEEEKTERWENNLIALLDGCSSSPHPLFFICFLSLSTLPNPPPPNKSLRLLPLNSLTASIRAEVSERSGGHQWVACCGRHYLFLLLLFLTTSSFSSSNVPSGSWLMMYDGFCCNKRQNRRVDFLGSATASQMSTSC